MLHAFFGLGGNCVDSSICSVWAVCSTWVRGDAVDQHGPLIRGGQLAGLCVAIVGLPLLQRLPGFFSELAISNARIKALDVQALLYQEYFVVIQSRQYGCCCCSPIRVCPSPIRACLSLMVLSTADLLCA